MDFKTAFWKGLRTFFQTFAGLAVAIPTAHSLIDVKIAGTAWFLDLYGAAVAGVIAFTVSAGESGTGKNILPAGSASPAPASPENP